MLFQLPKRNMRPRVSKPSGRSLMVESLESRLLLSHSPGHGGGGGNGGGGGGGGGGDDPPPPADIVYTGAKGLYTTTPSGDPIVNVMGERHAGSPPRWTPSGDKIRYFKDDQLMESNADGSNRVEIQPGMDFGEVHADKMDWSPDGKVLLFTTGTRMKYWVEGTTDIVELGIHDPSHYPLDADGDGIAEYEMPTEPIEYVPFYTQPSFGVDLDDSTAGFQGWITFVSLQKGSQTGADIHFVRVNQTNGVLTEDMSTFTVWRIPIGEIVGENYPVFSPDLDYDSVTPGNQSKLVFSSHTKLFSADVTITDSTVTVEAASASEATLLFEESCVPDCAPTSDNSPSWSPAGDRLVFSGLTGRVKLKGTYTSMYDIFTVWHDGSGLTNLTNTTTTREVRPDWNPTSNALRTHQSGAGASSLSVAQAAPLLQQAADYWQVDAAGLEIAVADLPAGRLAEAVGNTITIDRDADGHGWSSGGDHLHAPQYDLLSVLTHEVGHAIGHDHVWAHDDVMSPTLARH